MRTVVTALSLVGVLGALPSGCGAGASQATPERAVHAFATAVREGRHEDAYDMMAADYRRRVPFDEFQRHLTEHPAEARELVESMSSLSDEPEVVATVPVGDGEELAMVEEDGEWRLAGNVVDFYDQSSPRAALRSFVRAMERQRYDVVMRFVPDADRQGMTVGQMEKSWQEEGREDIERLLSNLRVSLDNPIEIVGDRATMPYGERYTVQFVREDGVWKIEDPD